MKTLQTAALTILVLGAGLLSVGCSTPAYSGSERWARVGNNISYESAQMQDDIDHVLMLRPGSMLTIWSVQGAE